MTRPLAEQQMKAELLVQGLKLCTHCEDVKSIDEFGPRPKNSDGLECWCKDCRREYQRQWRQDNPERARARDKAYRRTPQYEAWLKKYRTENEDSLRAYRHQYYEENKEAILEQCREYYANDQNREHKRIRTKVYRQLNKERLNDYNKKWRRRNPDKARAQKQRYRARHLKRIRAEEKQYTKCYRQMYPERVAAQLARYRARRKGAEGSHTDTQWTKLLELCYNRCVKCGEETELTRDHIMPLSWGGTDYIDNIQPLCHKHNSRKSAQYAIDYRPRHVRRWAYEEVMRELEPELAEVA